MEPQFEIRYKIDKKALREFYRRFGSGPRYPTVAVMAVDIAWNALRVSRRNNDGVMPETRITVGETIEMDEGIVHVSLEYRKLRRVMHLKHSYVLMLGRRNGLIIDPNGFTKGTFAEFKQFLREKRPDLDIPE